MVITWKVAAAGGAAVGLGIGGFVLNNQGDPSFQPVRDVDLQSANDDISSLSSPIKVTTTTTSTTTTMPPVAPPPTVDDSPDTPDAPVAAPAPAPSFDDSEDSPVQPAPSSSDDSASADDAASDD